MIRFPILSLMTLLPFAGALLLLLSTKLGRSWVVFPIRFSMIVSTLVLGLGGYLAFSFDFANSGFQFVEKTDWIPTYGISYHRGVDGLSLVLVLLTCFIFPLAFLASTTIKKNLAYFMAALLVLESLLIGAFTTLDIVLFYVFFEAALIPMFLIIGLFGGDGRVRAAYKFFLYTFGGSVLMLAAVIALVIAAGTSDMTLLATSKIPFNLGLWIFLGFFASFAVKTPLWPFHTWLPLAHVEAPTAGSVLLAALLLKLGTYGFIRLSLQMLPEASHFFAPFIIGLGVISILYGSLVALAQTDIKRLVAYSSVAHMGFAVLGIFSFTLEGLYGASMIMLSHGIISAGLFLSVGVLYERFHTRDITRFGGLLSSMPSFALVFMVLTLGAVGLPGTSGFIGEFMSLQGLFARSPLMTFAASIGVILGAVYMLSLYRRLFLGFPNAFKAPDIDRREWILFIPLIVLIFGLGVAPSFMDRYFTPTISALYQTRLSEVM